MIVYTNADNPLTLKLLICSKLGNVKVQVELAHMQQLSPVRVSNLPVLVLPSGQELFSVAQACKYLFNTKDAQQVCAVDQWWEWSMTLLAPALHQLKVPLSAELQSYVTRLYSSLNTALMNNAYLSGALLSSADISIWVLLSHLVAYAPLDKLPQLRTWYESITKLHQVQESLAEFKSSPKGLDQCNKQCGIRFTQRANPESDATLADADVAVPEKELAEARAAFQYKPFVATKEPRTVLPIPGKKNVLITSALPYVNNVPHLGNIIGCVLSADIFARYSRMANYNTLFVCGTDEYGTATEAKALAENLTPQQICDKYFELHNNIYRWFGIGFDYFGRTSTPEQTQIAQEMFLDLRKAGFVDTESVDQLLCKKCDRYLADRFVEGTCPYETCRYVDARGDQCDQCGKLMNATELLQPRCSVCRQTPEVVQSQQFFINLPKIEPQLREWFATVEHGWSHNARVITKAWLKEGLRPRCITRDLKWGIPVPVAGFEKKVFYVWFDAPIGYLSITARYTPEWRQWWMPKPDSGVQVTLYQFMAKDNVPFHSVMFPSTLLGLNQGHTMVSHLMATEYLNYEDGKFSKSRGIGVFGNDAQSTGIPSDVWRFYLASARPEGQDSNFSWTDLVTRNNSELLNNFGNFVNRALVFCEKNFDSRVGAVELDDTDTRLLALVNRECAAYVQAMETAKFRDGIRHLLTVSRLGNQYLQAQQPWVQLKGDAVQQQRAASVIGLCCNLCCLLATLLFPFMPATARQIYKQLNTEARQIDPIHSHFKRYFEAGHVIGKPVPLFTKIPDTQLHELKAKYGGQQETNAAAKPTTEQASLNTRADIERAISEQGEKVRTMKASGAEKALVKTEVQVLLKLKKHLTEFDEQPKTTKKPLAAPNGRAELERAVAEQGEKVRKLKASGAEKSIVKSEVDVLLKLKQQLVQNGASVQTEAAIAQPTPDHQSRAELERAVADQADLVRKLKASGTEKSAVKLQIDLLLKLKKQFAECQSA